MSEPDFSGIDPLRVPEARRRIAALNTYLALSAPTAKDTQRLAESIGLSRTQFSRLARVWRDHRDARLLVIGKRGAATRDYGIDPRAVAIADDVIERAGASATLARLAPDIQSRCAAIGATPPSRQTIYNWIRTARTVAGAATDGSPRVVVGRMWFHLPVNGLPADAMPTLLAAVLLPERLIVAHTISTDPQTPPSVADVIASLARTRVLGAPPRPLLLDPDDRRVAADALDRAGLGDIRSHDRSVQRELSKAFAGRLGPLAAIHQRGMARPATKRVITRQDEALPAADVVVAIEEAVAASDAAFPTEIPEFDLASR